MSPHEPRRRADSFLFFETQVNAKVNAKSLLANKVNGSYCNEGGHFWGIILVPLLAVSQREGHSCHS